MRGPRSVLVLFLTAALGGCAGFPQAPAPAPGCDPNAEQPLNHLAPLAPGLRGNDAQVAANVAAAFKLEPPTNVTEPGAPGRFVAGAVRLDVARLPDGAPAVFYFGPKPTVTLSEALTTLGVTLDEVDVWDFESPARTAWQDARAERDGSIEMVNANIGWRSWNGTGLRIDLFGLRAPLDAPRVLDPVRAHDLGEAYAACRVAMEFASAHPPVTPMTYAGHEPFGAWNDTLTFAVSASFQGLPADCASVPDRVHVDAVSGRIVAYEAAACPGRHRAAWTDPTAVSPA